MPPHLPPPPPPEPPRLPRASLSRRDVPDEVQAVLATLREAGFDAALVGGCVRDLLLDRPVADFDVATAAPPEVVLARFPRAVPIGLRHGTVMVPTRRGPVDVTTFRAGPRLEDDLARRDFTVNAIAFRADDGALVDPFGGRADLAAGLLRATGDAAARLAEDPLRGLRAARLVATLGLVPDAALEAALPAVRAPLQRVARERVRHELARLLAAPGADAGLRLLRRADLERDLAPEAAPDAPELVRRLPPDLALRLAAWLRAPAGAPGTGGAADAARARTASSRAESALLRLRFPRRVALHVAGLVRSHPVEREVDPRSDASVRRLLRRASEADLGALLRLRDAELAAHEAAAPEAARAGREALGALRDAIARVRRPGELALQRPDLALDGRGVMEALGCGPGPHVGEALRRLLDRVLEDPSLNTPERLVALLRADRAASEG